MSSSSLIGFEVEWHSSRSDKWYQSQGHKFESQECHCEGGIAGGTTIWLPTTTLKTDPSGMMLKVIKNLSMSSSSSIGFEVKMDKDNEIVKLREHYQYLEEYLQQEISKHIEIHNEMIRRKSNEILRPCLVFFFHHSISITQFPSLITHHLLLITLNTTLVGHHHSISITQYFSHYLWVSYLVKKKKKRTKWKKEEEKKKKEKREETENKPKWKKEEEEGKKKSKMV